MKNKSNILKIEEKTSDDSVNIALDTIKINKQAIIFVNNKRSTENLSEKVAAKNSETKESKELSEKILKVLPHPTKQCVRLAKVVKNGAAFHHAGLLSQQRELIEDGFREGTIKVIAATPTLAAGVDLPAYRVIIRDLKRFGLWGLQYIPVLEYQQQAGRAGRPSYDDHGEAICVCSDEKQKEEIIEKYLNGEPEEIISKLAVEPIMRTYVLSLIASEFAKNTEELEDFFSRTFYAKQFGDMKKLKDIIWKILSQLEDWGFIEKKNPEDFISAMKMSFRKDLKATPLGKRVTELYIDPYTANFLVEHIKSKKEKNSLSLTHLICSCLEMRPLLRVKSKEMDDVQEFINTNDEKLLTNVPELFDEDYEEFLNVIKTTIFFTEWLDEKDEEYLLEKYDVRPGEIASKKDIADWLLYSLEEISRLLKLHPLIKEIAKLRFRLKYGAKEELIPLLQLKNIGRVRARIMFKNNIKDIADVKKVDITTLAQLIGKSVAIDVKKQVGQEFSEDKVIVKEHKRKGQKNLNDYDK
jgi:helicase